MEKIAPKLDEVLQGSEDSQMFNIILELKTKSSLDDTVTEKLPKNQRIAKLREGFLHIAGPVEETIRKLGGDVISVAWINHTISAKVPARSIAALAGLDRVELLDLPQAINADC